MCSTPLESSRDYNPKLESIEARSWPSTSPTTSSTRPTWASRARDPARPPRPRHPHPRIRRHPRPRHAHPRRGLEAAPDRLPPGHRTLTTRGCHMPTLVATSASPADPEHPDDLWQRMRIVTAGLSRREVASDADQWRNRAPLLQGHDAPGPLHHRVLPRPSASPRTGCSRA